MASEPDTRALDEALATLPQLETPRPRLLEELRRLGFDSEKLAPLKQRDTLADVVVAVACLAGDRVALRQLDALVERASRETAGRLQGDPSEAAEVAQALRARLLVGGQRSGPSLETYDGRGSLIAWLRVSATRQALMARRSSAGTVGTPEVAAVVVDPELDLLRADGAQEVKAAFAAAFSELPGADRMLLAYHHLDELPLREIGRILNVHTSTVHRRLTRVREDLLARVRRQYAEQVGANDGELERVVALVGSRLDLSISRVLRTSPEARGG